MVNAELENDIWERIFGKHVLDVQCAESTLLLSEPPLNFAPLQRAVSEMVFEKFNFASFCRATSPFLASWANPESFVDSSTTQIFNPSGSGGGGTADCGADDGSSSNSTARTLKPFDPTISLFLDSGAHFLRVCSCLWLDMVPANRIVADLKYTHSRMAASFVS